MLKVTSLVRLACVGLVVWPSWAWAEPASGPLRVLPDNPRYFTDGSGRVVYLAGSHDGWELQDYAWEDEPDAAPFAWREFLDSLAVHGHNLSRMWMVEASRRHDQDARLTSPMPYRRVSGRGKANDGEDRFDLGQWNEEYFVRLRSRVREAGDRGVYVIVMLFQGWSIYQKREDSGNPWPYHPFHRANNVNGLDGDLNGDGQGREVHTWMGENHPVTRRQREYVGKVIDTVNDLDNVLYEIANESHLDSAEWQYRMIDFVHAYERRKPKQHPVGMTVPFEPKSPGPNSVLFDSPADWISPSRGPATGYNFRGNPPPGDGRKVILADTDHIFGIGCRDARWVWKTFCRGHNLLYMDSWTLDRRSPDREQVRRSLGQTRHYAARMDLAGVRPSPEAASSGYCLCNPGREYLAYLPDGGPVAVDLSAASGLLSVEWFDPRAGKAARGGRVEGGGRREFQPPFSGEAVLYLRDDQAQKRAPLTAPH